MRREIRGHSQVREAASDYETYSSDLLGDRDVRSYRQLPLEVDPPRHNLFRHAVRELFLAGTIEAHATEFEALAKRLITGIVARGGGEISTELALPYVIGCLTIIYNRPQDFDEWLAWGPDVWTAEAHAAGTTSDAAEQAQRERNFDIASERSGATLQAYLDRVFDAAEANPNHDPETQDVWDFVSQIQIEGKRLTRAEMQGIANVLLAGGRDTVIKLVTGLVWHLTETPTDREFLLANRDWFERTIAEMVRFLTPLPKMERVLPEDRTPNDSDRDPSKYVLLNFVSANYDTDVWPNPEVVDIHRERKPHLGFGFGRHICLGVNMTRVEAEAFMRVLLEQWPGWSINGEPEIEWATDLDKNGGTIRYIDRFRSLRVQV
jgi:cytochrome P450